MRILARLTFVLLIFGTTASPAAAHTCDPGRASNGADSKAWVERFGTSVSDVEATPEIHRPYLESGQFENQFIELRNGNNYMRVGVNYTSGIGTRVFVQGTGQTTGYLDISNTDRVRLRISTFETPDYRSFTMYSDSTIVRSVRLFSGRWTPNQVEMQVFSSNLGNQIVGHPADGAYFLNDEWVSNAGTLQIAGAGIFTWTTDNFPGTAATDGLGFNTRDNC